MLEFDQSLPSFSEIENSLKKRIETSSLSKSNFSLENIKEIQTDNNQNQLFGIPHEESMEEINFNRIKQVKFECPSKEERNLERSQSLLKNPSFPSLANEKTFGIIRKNTNSDEIIDKSTENFIHRFGKNSYWDGIEGFEKMKDYEFYYPGNNISQIKKNYNRHEARKKSIFELLKKKYYTKKKNIKTD